MAISSNSSNMGVTKLQEAQIEIDNLLSKELARKKKNDDNMSEQAKKDMGSYKTPYEIKLENAKKVYADTQKKLTGYIQVLSQTKVPGTDKTYIEEFFNGQTDGLTLARIGTVLAGKDMTPLELQEIKMDVNGGTIAEDKPISIQRTFMDRVKDLGRDGISGKGKALGAAKAITLFGMLAGITKGVTTLLADKLLIPNSMGLIGLAKTGLSKLPLLGSMAQSGASMAFAWCPEMMIAFGAAGAMVAVPWVLRKLKVAGAKVKDAMTTEKQFADKFAQPATT